MILHLTAARLRIVFSIALPITGGMLSQVLLNLIDTAMVGTLGPTALAAVGVGSYATFMATATVMGLGSGVQALAARRIGEERTGEAAVPLNGALVFAVVAGAPISLLLWSYTPELLALLNPDPALAAEGAPYLRARVLGVIAVGMNFSFRGYWAGVSLTRYYMQTLIIMHVCNVVLNYTLIFGHFGAPAMGVEGAGLATSISLYLGVGVYAFLAWRHGRGHGFLRAFPSAASMLSLLKLSLPTAVQQFLFAAGFTALFWIVGQIGTEAVAISHVLTTFILVALLPGMAFGLAIMTRVSEALGRNDPDDADRWGWQGVAIICVVMGSIALPGVVVPDLLLSGFIHDPAIREMGVGALRLVAAGLIVDAVTSSLMNSLLGAGATRQVMVVSVSSQWLFGLPLAWLTAVYFGYGLIACWACFIGYRGVQAAAYAVMWSRGDWKKIKI